MLELFHSTSYLQVLETASDGEFAGAAAPAGSSPRLLHVTAEVGDPSTPLPEVARERAVLLERFSPDVDVLDGAEATTGAVLEAMRTHAAVHFSCHGQQLLENPLDSYLLVGGAERLTLSMVAREAAAAGALMVLAACKTTMLGVKASAEFTSMAGEFVQAGWKKCCWNRMVGGGLGGG